MLLSLEEKMFVLLVLDVCNGMVGLVGARDGSSLLAFVLLACRSLGNGISNTVV